MRPDRVVVLAPLFDDDLRFLEAIKDFAVQKLVAQLAIEALAISVLPWTSWFDVERFRADASEPIANRMPGELASRC